MSFCFLYLLLDFFSEGRLEWPLLEWLCTELLSEPLFLDSDDSCSEGGEQELRCSSTKVSLSDAVPADGVSGESHQSHVFKILFGF